MIRIALVGDSHLANWKRAWRSLCNDYTDAELVFFAAPGTRLACGQPRGDRLVFEQEDVAQWLEVTSGGRRELVPADYDVLCVVGLRFGVRVATDLYVRWRADAHLGQEGKFHLVSDACFLDAVCDQLGDSPAIALIRKLRCITDKAIWLAPQPAPSEIALTFDNFPHGIRWATEANDAPALRAAYEEGFRRVAVADLHFLDQPKITLASPVLSKDEYRRESETTTDWTHLNDAFGEIALRELLSHFLPARERIGGMPKSAGRSAESSVWSTVKRALGSKLSQFSNRS